MKSPFLKRSTRERNREQGVTIALVALALIAIMAIAALSIDVVTLYLANAQMQRSADAAALAGARVLSISGMTADPTNATGQWTNACALATQVATAVAEQDTVFGTQLVNGNVNVTYPNNSDQATCTGTTAAFGVNPLVRVKVQRTDLPTFFARIFGLFNTNWREISVSASATAEAFNPSFSNNAGNGGTKITTPVQPRCVKPWMIPNYSDSSNDPIVAADGNITGTSQGIIVNGTGSGLVGQMLTLRSDCQNGGGNCNPSGGAPSFGQYAPGAVADASVAVPACGSGTPTLYEDAITGCDESTVYQCGVSKANTIDLSENPNGANGDTHNGVSCLIHDSAGHDTLDTTSYPYKIYAGAGNPLVANAALASGSQITNSNSIVSLPIFDQNNYGGAFSGGNTVSVTVVGFLQVFVDSVASDGDLNVTVLNVAGCGNGTNSVGTPVTGSSPVPVRLVQKYP